jgi:Transcription elongation factor, GreA/GreB, C-term
MDTQDASPRIALNCRITVELVDSSGAAEQSEFTLVTSKQADLRSGLLDENAPLGKALLGRHAGETIAYAVGDLREVRILKVESEAGNVSPEAAQKRRADVRKAKVQSEITNQMIFSTASGSKWGDYEVNMDKLLKDDEEEPEK